jgi:CRP-like cAMP-binding protein
MQAFLRKLSLMTTVREAILLSGDGAVLLRSRGGEEIRTGGGEPWPAILAAFGEVSSAELRFTKGCYCLRRTPLGMIAVGLAGDAALPAIRKALDNVGEKLADAAVCHKVLRHLLPLVDEAGRRYLLGLQSRPTGSSVLPKAAPPSGVSRDLKHSNREEDEKEIREALQHGDKQQAILLIMEKITDSARGRRFDQAERLRDWLLQIDPMALVECVRAAELIEEEKAAAIGPEVKTTYKELLRTLSNEEFAALYHAAVEHSYADGEIVVKQGTFEAALFLVNRGQVQVTAGSEGRQMLLNNYGPGDVLGGENFFDASVWTTTVISRGASLSRLRRAKLIAMKESHPALYGKLQNFCGKYPTAGMLFKKHRRTRRGHERHKAQGRVAIDVLDGQGRDTGLTLKSELLDLSRGGVALSLRFSKKKNAAALLGQLIRVHLRPKAATQALARTGQVKAVLCHDFVGNEYSLHVQFDAELESKEVLLFTGGGEITPRDR